ncbi:MAG: hypothetical protein LBS71_02780 [Puniceicoccales bacterium]|jgi:hypothetical protein|nr:hypothetical protein [Puniceicoccales bacterium]
MGIAKWFLLFVGFILQFYTIDIYVCNSKHGSFILTITNTNKQEKRKRKVLIVDCGMGKDASINDIKRLLKEQILCGQNVEINAEIALCLTRSHNNHFFMIIIYVY